MATSDIAAGEVIVRVPKSFLMSNDLLYKTYGAHPLSTHQLLALHLVLLLAQGGGGTWKPYLDLLPSHFNTLPVTFPPMLFDQLPDALAGKIYRERGGLEKKRLIFDYYYYYYYFRGGGFTKEKNQIGLLGRRSISQGRL